MARLAVAKCHFPQLGGTCHLCLQDGNTTWRYLNGSNRRNESEQFHVKEGGAHLLLHYRHGPMGPASETAEPDHPPANAVS
ncbi:hypothetical protein DPX16_9627 [Anabarilius grahami]|uniref:Uncharacterized protein n=1 Tax=Anabarilius grahami TaxID=495550 RepID=A0A3N0Y368_ANAGA|nr:hypothetical protein DPX16_9627 [Anabarilius grahami]